MATFHPFPRLPAELRIQIWESATEDRVLRVKKTWNHNQGYWSPSPVPAVTRASRESRHHCSYRKAFIIASSPRYIWTNFDHDVIRTRSSVPGRQDFVERNKIRRLKLEWTDGNGEDYTNSSYLYEVYCVSHLCALESVDLLVGTGLARGWGNLIKTTYWGACPRKNVRAVSEKTGEWVDEEASGVFQDYDDISG
jgi:hypothetical protein